MQGDLKKALEIVSRHAAMAQGNHSFGHLKAKPVGHKDGEELNDIEMHGMPASKPTPGANLNESAQEAVLAHQDHQLPVDEFLPGSLHEEPDADDAGGPSDQDEDNAKPMSMGFMSTNPAGRSPPPVKPKKRMGRPRGSK